jgi:tetratricopeptide (TPR) repeat protein
MAHLNAGQYQDAAADFSRAIEIRPDNPIPYKNRAHAWYALKEYARALADLETCAKLHGNVDAGFRKAVLQLAGTAQ